MIEPTVEANRKLNEVGDVAIANGNVLNVVSQRTVAAASWLSVEDVDPDPALLAVLDRGEAAALPLAEKLGATLLVDDRDARAVARERGIAVVGSLGVLLIAKQRHQIDAVASILGRMESLGMFVSVELRRSVLRLAGESARQQRCRATHA